MRRDPYTVARELDRAITAMQAQVEARASTSEILDGLWGAGALCRELRRAMVRRVEPIHRTEESDNA